MLNGRKRCGAQLCSSLSAMSASSRKRARLRSSSTADLWGSIWGPKIPGGFVRVLDMEKFGAIQKSLGERGFDF